MGWAGNWLENSHEAIAAVLRVVVAVVTHRARKLL